MHYISGHITGICLANLENLVSQIKNESGLFIQWHIRTKHERTTTAKNMGILKYHPTSLIRYERGWPLACLEDLIKQNQASHQGARWTSSVPMLKVPVLALIIETSAHWPWYRRSFQYICRGLWIIIAEFTCGLFPMIFRMVFPSWKIWSACPIQYKHGTIILLNWVPNIFFNHSYVNFLEILPPQT
jgi:hypothetical protein